MDKPHRVEPCACGEDVVQRCGETELEAVTRHNAGAAHLNWRWQNVPMLHPQQVLDDHPDSFEELYGPRL